MVNKKYYKKKPRSIFLRSKDIFLQHESEFFYVFIPVILLIIFQILSVITISVKRNAEISRITTRNYALPVGKYLFLTKPIEQPISAQSAVILDRVSKTVLYEKNSHVRFSMASTTKLMTALVGAEYFKPDDILSTYTTQVEGVNVGVEMGSRLFFKDALYGLLLPSGNDIALMIAQNYPGGEKAFVQKMNQKAKELHLVNTYFADPAGLNDDGNYTTASELAELATQVAKNEEISLVIGTKFKVISTVDNTRTFELSNLNRLLGYYGVTGMKTGHTEGAGDVLITSTTLSGHEYIIVVMQSQDRFSDTEILLGSLLAGVGSFTPRDFEH